MIQFLITQANVDSFDTAIRHIRDNLKASIYPTKEAENEAKEALAALLTIYPKPVYGVEPTWVSRPWRGPTPGGGAA